MSTRLNIFDNDYSRFCLMELLLARNIEQRVIYRLFSRTSESSVLSSYFDYIFNEHYDVVPPSQEELSFLIKNGLHYTSYYLERMNVNELGETVLMRKTADEVIEIEGNWIDVLKYLTPLQSLLSELLSHENDYESGTAILEKKIAKITSAVEGGIDLKIVELGTRRRSSYRWQMNVIEELDRTRSMYATGNARAALTYNYPVSSIMNHDYILGFGSMGVSENEAIDIWHNHFDLKSGPVLTDTFGSDRFFESLPDYLYRNLCGFRHDSGCPMDWTDTVFSAYKLRGIDLSSKILMYSDSLDIDDAILISKYVGKKAKTSFGIGRSLTNDFGIKQAETVFKMVSSGGIAVVKDCDDSSKNTISNYIENYL